MNHVLKPRILAHGLALALVPIPPCADREPVLMSFQARGFLSFWTADAGQIFLRARPVTREQMVQEECYLECVWLGVSGRLGLRPNKEVLGSLAFCLVKSYSLPVTPRWAQMRKYEGVCLVGARGIACLVARFLPVMCSFATWSWMFACMH